MADTNDRAEMTQQLREWVRKRFGARNRGDELKLDNRHTIGGVQRRCTFIGLKELLAWQEDRG